MGRGDRGRYIERERETDERGIDRRKRDTQTGDQVVQRASRMIRLIEGNAKCRHLKN